MALFPTKTTQQSADTMQNGNAATKTASLSQDSPPLGRNPVGGQYGGVAGGIAGPGGGPPPTVNPGLEPPLFTGPGGRPPFGRLPVGGQYGGVAGGISGPNGEPPPSYEDTAMYPGYGAGSTGGQPTDSQNDNQPKIPQPNENDPNNVTVESRLEGLLNKDNPYLQAARARAAQQANARGLQNSSIAATAGEKAAIESALPIAQQDAGYYQQRGLNQQTGDINSRLQAEQGDIQRSLYETQGDISSRLQMEQGEIEQRLAAQGFEYDRVLKQMDNNWKQMDLQARMQVEYDRMDQENKSRFDNTVNVISDSYMRDYMEILINPNFASDADRQKAIDTLNEVTRNRYKIAGQIAGVELDWGGTGDANMNDGEGFLTEQGWDEPIWELYGWPTPDNGGVNPNIPGRQ